MVMGSQGPSYDDDRGWGEKCDVLRLLIISSTINGIALKTVVFYLDSYLEVIEHSPMAF